MSHMAPGFAAVFQVCQYSTHPLKNTLALVLLELWRSCAGPRYILIDLLAQDCLTKIKQVLYTEAGQPFLVAGSGTLGW